MSLTPRIILVALGISLAPSALAAQCEWPVTEWAVHGTYRVRDFHEDPLLESPVLTSEIAYSRFLDWVRSRTESTDPWDLLERQRALYARAGIRDDVFDLILARRVGWMSAINCLESLLFAEHESRFPHEKAPSEFAAFLLKRPDTGILRIYYVPGDGLAVRHPPELLRKIAHDRASGWVVHAHLHNHPFLLLEPRRADYAGTVIPSEPDRRFLRMCARDFGLLEGRVTNGIHTLRIPASEFPLLVSGIESGSR